MDKYLIAIDLDGTALYDMVTMTNNTKNTLLKLKELGHQIVIATGRSYRTTIDFYELLNLTTPMICLNGSLITNPSLDNSEANERFLTKELVVEIYNDNKDLIENSYCEFQENYYLVKEEDWLIRLINPNKQHGVLKIGPYEEILTEDPTIFNIIAKKGMTEQIENNVKQKYPGFLSARNWGGPNKHVVEVFRIDTTKGSALEIVANELGFPMERVIAFGDNENDYEMIKVAGFGVAMDNAPDMLKGVADLVIGHHQQEGLATYLQKRFKL